MPRWPLLLLAAFAPAHAEVLHATDAGFGIRARAEIKAPPAAVWGHLVQVGRWWSDAHTYSGKASRMRLKPQAGGCFCETIPGQGSIEHARVLYAQPGQALRLSGGLGPLQGMAVVGTLTWTLRPTAQGTELQLDYRVAGHDPEGLAKLAPLVGQVLGEQQARLQRWIETGKP